VEEHQLDGVGFVFLEADGYVGVDFDDCRQNELVHSEVLSWLKWLPTYQEVSPSGTGVHVIGRGSILRALTATAIPNAGNAQVELYNKGRYFTFTGQHLNDVLQVTNVQIGIDKLLRTLGSTSEVAETEPPKPLSRLAVKKIHDDNLYALRHARQGEGNATLNSVAFFAARGFAAGVLDGSEESLKKTLFDIVTREWRQPHDEHGARQTIESGWRSGLDQPLIIKDDDFAQVLETMEDFNRRFFLVKKFGNKARVCSETLSRISKGETYVLDAQPIGDFKIGFMNQKIVVGMKEDGTPKIDDRASVWLNHKYRREYTKVVFEPMAETPPDVYNLWRGFAYRPVKGDCNLYLAHLRDNVCQGDAKKYGYLISWMAYAVRHPNEQGHVAIVIQGLKGVGKNCAAEPFADLFGQHGIVVSDQARITRNFNSHLRDKCTLICDEAFFAGDRRHEGVLKALITGNTITIESKGVDVETVPNLLHVIIIGNDAWLVPASYEERRFLMLSCGAQQQQNQAYFKAIITQLEHGGYEALLYHLLQEVDLKNFNVREAPHTAELREQMSESLRGVEAAWFECLYSGVLPARVKKDGTAELRTDTFIEWARNNQRGWSNLKPQHVNLMLGVNPRGDKMGFDFTKADPLIPGGRQRYWDIPRLSLARKIWDERRFVTLWPADGGEWDALSTEEVKF
jgi:hypothetical protein